MKDHEIYDKAAESSILSAMMGGTEVAAELGAVLKAGDFYIPRNQILFTAIKQLADAGMPTDFVAVIDKLGMTGNLEKAGGDSYVLEVAGDYLSYVHYPHYVKILKRHSLRRSLTAAAQRIRDLAVSEGSSEEELADRAEAILGEVTTRAIPNGSHSLADVTEQVHMDMVAKHSGTKDPDCIHFGIGALDGLFPDGIKPGQLVVVGARPSVGKTAFAVFCGAKFAKKGRRVAIYSEEMSNEEITYRLFSLESSISSSTLSSGSYAGLQEQLIAEARDRLVGFPIILNDEPGMTVSRMQAQCRRKVIDGKAPEVIIVDYLQLLQSPAKGAGRYQEVSELSRALKLMARELHVPVIALAQLSRQSEQRPDRRPMMSDLRDSGSIEQDADVVLLLDASATEEEASRPERPDWGKRRVIVAKHRNGPVGEVDLNFSPSTCTFAD